MRIFVAVMLLSSIVLTTSKQIGIQVGTFNIKSSVRTLFSCSRIHNITIENYPVEDWSCFGGTLARDNQPGMWIILKGLPTLSREGNLLRLEVGYEEYIVETVFPLEDLMNRQFESFSSFDLEIVRKKGTLNPSFIPFDEFGNLVTPPTRSLRWKNPNSAVLHEKEADVEGLQVTTANVTMTYFQFPMEEPTLSSTNLLLITVAISEALIIVVFLLDLVFRCSSKKKEPPRVETEMKEMQDEPADDRKISVVEVIETDIAVC
ncbi:hypothetical protein OESDEN_01526 [Oesophagostomum dentatum]|uniref:Uncharacterized protein n=1 Tax=Oesophagostomum dentatum TaxID=61180 RepID=A0A0B1TSU3_OESDE|nr:hypothetical protein OESDEN_01526 [Oesophagostomum dentatum]